MKAPPPRSEEATLLPNSLPQPASMKLLLPYVAIFCTCLRVLEHVLASLFVFFLSDNLQLEDFFHLLYDRFTFDLKCFKRLDVVGHDGGQAW